MPGRHVVEDGVDRHVGRFSPKWVGVVSLLGIDVGTSGLKVTAVEADTGRAIGSAYREYPQSFPRPGWVVLDADLVWRAFCDALRQLNAERSVKRDPVEALGFSVSCDEIVLVDNDKQALAQVILSPDTRGSELLPEIRERVDEHELYRRTGLPLHPMFPLVRLLWYQKYDPDTLRRASRFQGWAEFLIWRMGLEPAADHTNAARWMAFDVHELRWSERLIEDLGLPLRCFPAVTPSAHVLGELPATCARDLGFAGQPLVATGAIDGICAAIGSGMRKPGDAVVLTGTWEHLTVLTSAIPDRAETLGKGVTFTNFVNTRLFAAFASNATGGAILRWFRDQFGRSETDPNPTGRDTYDLLLAEAASEPTGILVLPHFQGSHSPWADPLSRGTIIGLTWRTTRGQFLRALLEGTAFELRANVEHIAGLGASVPMLRNTGGGSRSELWCQLKADVLGMPIETVDVLETGCLGAAILAGVAVGRYRSFEDPQMRFVRPRQRYLPDPARAARYEQLYRIYGQVYSAVAPISHALEDTEGADGFDSWPRHNARGAP